MPANDREVLRYLAGNGDPVEPIDLLTFAMFAYEREAWLKHYAGQNSGNEPSQTEIDNWTANISEYHFESLRQQAVAFFDTASREYLKNEIADATKRALETAIIAEVKSAASWHRQFGIAVVTAVLTPIILGLAVAGILSAGRYMPAVIQIDSTDSGNQTGQP